METTKNIDETLSIIGELGLHQLLTVAVLCFLTIPTSFQALIIYFVADNPTWRCVANSTVCTFEGEINSSNTEDYGYRCRLERQEWEYSEQPKYSIVTEVCMQLNKFSFIPKSIIIFWKDTFI